ncbi:MAG: hypothetical protein GX950_01405 [Candidatus Diapherotrites archaeon]|uniref:Uncharacterized protein n=1 Tax=Candidatus Iainarchaeum sp. TaxID=3101447 RepID=A0A7K4BZ31_9ARCH|nr:hypothetical protein [Candidatus Diapherotrites archaeon]
MRINKKGLFISTDSFVASVLVFILVLTSMVFLSQVSFNSWNSIDLINASRDVASVLEKSNILKNAINQNSAELISSSLINTPQSFCFEVTIFENTNLSLPIISTIKPGCVKYSKEISSVERTIVVNQNNSNKYYIARVSGWNQ